MPVTEQELFDRLARLGVAQTTARHPAVHTVEEAKALRGCLPGAHSKNLFLIDRKGGLWLVVVLEDRAVDLKRLRGILGCPSLSFARADVLRSVLGVEPGSVTPFALINDPECRVTLVLDVALLGFSTLNFHPLANTATTSVDAEGLLAFVRSCGREPLVVDLGPQPAAPTGEGT